VFSATLSRSNKEQSAMNRTLSTIHARRVRLLTYNVKMMPFDASNEERAALIAAHFKHYDVVCLQELFEGDAREYVQDEAARTYALSNRAEGPPADWMSGHFVDGGLTIMTRYEIVKQHYAEFSSDTEIGFDALANKGVAHALLCLDKKTQTHMHVFVAHTQSGESSGRRRGRWAQLQYIAEFVRQNTDHDTHPVMLLGDLNVNGNNAADYAYLNTILSNELGAERVVKDVSRNVRVTFPETNEKLDYAFAVESKNNKQKIMYSSALLRWSMSDHYALEVVANMQ
jgi:endonuclease/exonuclease/phosphatase family metal-dependent hydrolase